MSDPTPGDRLNARTALSDMRGCVDLWMKYGRPGDLAAACWSAARWRRFMGFESGFFSVRDAYDEAAALLEAGAYLPHQLPPEMQA